MPRATYGPKVQARAKSLLKMLLLFVKGELENSERFDIKYSWLDEDKPPQLRIETNLRTLEALTNNQGNRLKKSQIRESLKRMEDFLNILKIDNILDCSVYKLPERILEERCNSLTEDDNHIGHHLTLVWEDPNIVPPTLQFDSEAC